MTSTEFPRDRNKRLVLFHRDFQRFTGGHLKVWNYFNHVIASKHYEPRIAFTEGSKWDATNPWVNSTEYTTDWNPTAADVLFLAGKDWKFFSDAASYRGPIINFIQHPRHADPNDELYRFLSNRAIRICVSQQVADAINATGKVNGQVFVVPNGIATNDVPTGIPYEKRAIDVLISGLKNQELAKQLEECFSNRGLTVTSMVEWTPRVKYLEQLNNSKIAITLPRPSEGFYLPALEAMACGAIVVCPDCVGNRDYCYDTVNCFRPDYDGREIAAAAEKAITLGPKESVELRKKAGETVAKHSLEHERASFLKILERVDELWQG
jgi:glycosyltransferase involved in cell wall biosynthesis